MNESILRVIANELKDIFPPAQIYPMIKLYEEFADLETPVEKGIGVDWMENVEGFYHFGDTKGNNHKFLLNSESFFKKVLYVLSPDEYQECVADARICLYRTLEKIGLLSHVPHGLNISTCNPNRISNQFGREIAKAYQLRNSISHTSEDWSLSEMLQNVRAVMVATMTAVWDNREKLQKHISTATSNNRFGIDLVLKQIVKNYEEKISSGFSYVSLLWESAEEDGALTQSKHMDMKELEDDGQILLEGEAGCGKTTSLDELEYQAAKRYLSGESDIIPVKITLIDESVGLTLQEMICRHLNIPAAYCDSLLEQGMVYLFLDGLNEFTADDGQKKKLVMAIESFCETYPSIFVAATDRKWSMISLNVNKTYHLKRMGKQDILNYARSRSEGNEGSISKLSELLGRPGFDTTEYTPLMVNQLLIALAGGGEIPEDAGDLVGVYLEALMRREYEEKREIMAAPGKLDMFLMKLAMEEYEEDGLPRLQAMRLCASLATEYGVTLDSNFAITLAIQLGILRQNGNRIDFVLDDYRQYYIIRAIDYGMME